LKRGRKSPRNALGKKGAVSETSSGEIIKGGEDGSKTRRVLNIQEKSPVKPGKGGGSVRRILLSVVREWDAQNRGTSFVICSCRSAWGGTWVLLNRELEKKHRQRRPSLEEGKEGLVFPHAVVSKCRGRDLD